MDDEAVSTLPDVAETAGGPDGLDKALEAALKSVQLDEDDYKEEAVALPKEDRKPVKRKTETATEDASGEAEQETTPAVNPAEASLSAPANWDAQRREAFSQLPPPGQKILLDIARGFEAEHTKRSTELADIARLGTAVRGLVTDEHRQQMAGAGMKSEAEGVAYLLRLNDYARGQPGQYARWFVKETGLDPRQLFPELAGTAAAPQQGTAQQQAVLPQQFYSAIKPLASQLEALVQERKQERDQTAQEAINAFKGAKNPDGQPAHPHIAAVEQRMIEWLVNPEVAAKHKTFPARLKRAYELAVRDDDGIQQQIESAKDAARLAEKTKVDDVNKARRARAPIRSQPTGTVTVKPKGLDGALGRAMDEVFSSR